MANDLASYRTLVGQILATAVDSSTWTTEIIDDALRHAMNLYNRLPVYEISFTVASTDREQDLSTITDIDEVLAVAYPWSDGADFAARMRDIRSVADQTIYFEDTEPQEDEVIRVRYTKQHKIKDLDSAATTNIATRHARIVGLAAASHACVTRFRQLSENPATPKEALDALRLAASAYMDEAREHIANHRRGVNPHWTGIGL